MNLIYDIIKVEISKILYFALVDRLSCMRLFAMQTSYTTCMARRLRVMASLVLCIPSASHVHAGQLGLCPSSRGMVLLGYALRA